MKSVIEHHGPHGMSITSGHYSCKILLKNKWLVFNDNRKIEPSSTNPLGGYLFLYEKTPLNLSLCTLGQLVEDLERKNQKEDDVMRNQRSKHTKPENTSNTKKRKPDDTTFKNESYSAKSLKVDHLSRSELLKNLDDIDLTYVKKQITEQLRSYLLKQLQSKHKIHEFLRGLEISEFKYVAMKINMKYDQTHAAMRKTVAKYFFETYSDGPLFH